MPKIRTDWDKQMTPIPARHKAPDPKDKNGKQPFYLSPGITITGLAKKLGVSDTTLWMYFQKEWNYGQDTVNAILIILGWTRLDLEQYRNKCYELAKDKIRARHERKFIAAYKRKKAGWLKRDQDLANSRQGDSGQAPDGNEL